jgi:hypothetical protein
MTSDQMTSDQLPLCIDARRVRLRCDSAFGELDNNNQPVASPAALEDKSWI